MAKEKKNIQGNTISRQFTTMLPLDVIADLTKFAKQSTLTGMGKYDFGVALRILLGRAEHEERIAELEDLVYILQLAMQDRQPVTQEKKQPIDDSPMTFGKAKKEVVKQNE